ncbi:TBC domain-containing protein C4G8.04 [Leucoagaricus sp. SymC.cos]|nr:TBC domain-containing protein C4G8.04 [Leucoagaricus sp. SymC.cos]
MASSHLKTPAHSHPLSPDDIPSRGRRSREPLRTESLNTSNYFTLKAQLEQGTSDIPNWDGSVRGYPRPNKRKQVEAQVRNKPSAASLWGTQHPDNPLSPFVIGSSKDNIVPPKRHDPEFVITEVFDSDQYSPLVTKHVLTTKWHECSDDAVEGAISKLTFMEEPGDVVNHPYFTALRILSSAYHGMVYARQDLEECRRLVLEKEASRKQRADDLLNELQPSERDIARRVIQSIFTSDDENLHQVQRKQSAVSLMESLSEAIADEVPLSRSTPKPMTPMPEEPTFQLDNPSDLTPDLSATPAAEGTVLSNNESTIVSSPGESNTLSQTDVKQRQDRASVADWMGTWWGKPKSSRLQDGHATVASPSSSSSDNALPGRTPGRRKSAKSVFGTLGISILNPVPNASSKGCIVPENSAPPQIIPDYAQPAQPTTPSLIPSVAASANPSVVSSPIQHSFVPTLAAPTLTTTLDTSPKAASVASVSTSSGDPPVVMIQGATLRAIANATRIMTNDPSSILTDQGRDTSPFIATLAMELIKNARDEGIVFRDKPLREKKDVSAAAAKKDEKSTSERPMVTLSPSSGSDATMSLNRALNMSGDGPKKVSSKGRVANVRMSSPFTSPLFGTFVRQQRRKPSAPPSSSNQSTSSNAHQSPLSTATTSTQPLSKPKLTSVPMESIIPATSKPPTHYLARLYAHTPLTSRDFRFSIPLPVPPPHPHPASRFSAQNGNGSGGTAGDDGTGRPLLTDRYGFMYDVALYDVLLLMRARECGNSAPACLTGVKIADREEDNSWPEDDEGASMSGGSGTGGGGSGGGGGRGRGRESIEIVKGKCSCDGESDVRSVGSGKVDGEEGLQSPNTVDTQSLSVKSRSSSKSRKRSSVVISSGPTTATMSVNSSSGTGSTSLATSILSVNDDTPRHACASTIRKLLDQLTEIHDHQQAAQQKEWKVFVKQRSRIKASSNKPSSSAQASGTTNAILGLSIGLGLTNDSSTVEDEDADELGHTEGLINFAQLGLSSARDERREFDRLVRNGIPLCFRSKVWMECSGALELKEPGLFRDLLEAKDDGGPGSVVAEIEKDVGRTMPLNVFFGGDGAGVDKLRRVLVAYSRRNPAVGYCQGMNLITSTILLVHADEEDAFWMLAAIVEKILPEDFFSPLLLPSRACPLVLLDYVAEHLPKLHSHLTELGIDLGAICFSWFLSLFTDCLPVETLFRVWDAFLVDGLDVLFRIALGILRRNEQELLSCESIPAVYVALENLPMRMWEADKLLQVEAELRPILVHSDITAKRNKHVATLSQLMS